LILIFARHCEEKRERRKKSKYLDFDFDFVGTVLACGVRSSLIEGELKIKTTAEHICRNRSIKD